MALFIAFHALCYLDKARAPRARSFFFFLPWRSYLLLSSMQHRIHLKVTPGCSFGTSQRLRDKKKQNISRTPRKFPQKDGSPSTTHSMLAVQRGSVPSVRMPAVSTANCASGLMSAYVQLVEREPHLLISWVLVRALESDIEEPCKPMYRPRACDQHLERTAYRCLHLFQSDCT